MSWTYFLAWLLPLATGAAAYLAISPQRVPGWRASAVGYGFLGGMLLVAVATSIVAPANTAHAIASAGLCLLLLLAIVATVAWRRRDQSGTASSGGTVPLPRWQRAALATLFVSLVARAAIVAREIWLRPLYPWDAWSAWAVKPKTWFLLGHHVPFVSMPEWLHSTHGDLYTEVAWHYPNALAWIEVWFASAAGGWIEPLINLPWLGLWAALLLAHHGQWQSLGLSRTRALVAVYALGSLPLLSVHAALAGYADLWIASAFGFSVLSWMRWLQQGERSQLCLAIFFALVLPWLKMEGWVWAVCLLASFGFGALPWRWRSTVAIAAIVLFAALIPLGGLHLLSLRAGVINADGSLAMPALGPLALILDLKWQPGAFKGATETLFAQPNWHLLWWLTPPVLIWRWRALMSQDWLRLPAVLLGICAMLLFILFLFTSASAWAQSYTAINRLVLQIVPAWVTVLALLLRDVDFPAAERSTDPTRDPRSDPA